MANRPGELGQKLRAARERRGVSLRQIAHVTKIGVGALEALERNDVSRLPGGIFSRAFVRAYAIEVGLDPDRTMQEFLEQFGHDESVRAGHPAADRVEDYEAVESSRRTAAAFVRLVVMSIPVAIALIYFSGAGRPGPRPAAAPVAEPRAASAPTDAIRGERTEPGDALSISLTAIRDTRVATAVDGGAALEHVLPAGNRIVFEAHQQFVLTTSDASAVVLTVNGGDVRPLGLAGDPVTLTLTPGNFREHLVTP